MHPPDADPTIRHSMVLVHWGLYGGFVILSHTPRHRTNTLDFLTYISTLKHGKLKKGRGVKTGIASELRFNPK